MAWALFSTVSIVSQPKSEAAWVTSQKSFTSLLAVPGLLRAHYLRAHYLRAQSPQSPVISEPSCLRACDASDPRSPQSLRCLRIHVASGPESSLSVSNLRAPGVSRLMSPHSWCHFRRHCLTVLPPRSLVTSQDASSSSRSAPAQRCCPLQWQPSLRSSDLEPEHHSTRNQAVCFLPGN